MVAAFFFPFVEPRELFRPWKLATLAVGVSLLIYGALEYDISDWDIGISLIMAALTYLTAPAVVRVLLQRQYERWPGAVFWAWFSVDGCYWTYHSIRENLMLRDANAACSLPLYLFMGCVWMYRGSIADLARELRAQISSERIIRS